jgi:hypothetical protein
MFYATASMNTNLMHKIPSPRRTLFTHNKRMRCEYKKNNASNIGYQPEEKEDQSLSSATARHGTAEKKNREHRNLYRSEIRAASNFPARTAMPKSTTMLKGRALTQAERRNRGKFKWNQKR